MTDPKIVTVFASKGGVGKSSIAYELAWLLGAVLVDLDWDTGGVTDQWGHSADSTKNDRLLDALETGGTPRPLRADRRPDLVPSSPDLAINHPEIDEMAACLTKWAGEWGREFTVVDTHPGGSTVAFGAISAASVVVMPVILAMRELAALRGSLRELKDYPLLLAPNKVSSNPPSAMLNRFREIVGEHNVPVAPPISHYSWWPRRQLRAAVTSTEQPHDKRGLTDFFRKSPAKALAPAVTELQKLAETVKTYVNS